MKTDAQLKADVTSELAWDPSIDANAIGVMVKDGLVTLTGHLDSFAEKEAVERAARRVSGVRGIAVELDVKPSPEHKRSDSEIAKAVLAALRWHSLGARGARQGRGRARLGHLERRSRLALPGDQRRAMHPAAGGRARPDQQHHHQDRA